MQIYLSLIFILCHTMAGMAGRQETGEHKVIIWDDGHHAPGGIETSQQESHIPYSESTLGESTVYVTEGNVASLEFSVIGHKDQTVKAQAERMGKYSKPLTLHKKIQNSSGTQKYTVTIKIPKVDVDHSGEWWLRAFNEPNGKVLKLKKRVDVERKFSCIEGVC